MKATYSVAKPYNLRGTIYGKKISLKWDRANTVNGFEVYCKVGNGKYKKIADTSKNSYTYKKLSKKKTCYFKVRSYIMNNGVKEYSSFSAVVKARARLYNVEQIPIFFAKEKNDKENRNYDTVNRIYINN